jgi:RHS repeat-associated protein
VLESAGEGTSSYGFAAEMRDSYIKLIYLRSRIYSPSTGRFLTKDSWHGNYTRPLSLNGWIYVEADPINAIDPSGRCLDEDMDGKCDWPPPDIKSYNEKIPPAGIHWVPMTNPLSRGAGGIPYGENGAQLKINPGWTGLCGPISVAAIIRSEDPSVTAQEVVNKAYDMFGEANSLGAGNLANLTKDFVNENYRVRWYAEGGYITYWVIGEPNYWTKKGESRVLNQVSQWLTTSHLIIAGVKANGSKGKILTGGGVEHWVVITGISRDQNSLEWESDWNWVRVYNPFDNETEYYPWKDFRVSWENDGNMLTIIKPKKLLPVHDPCK